MKKLLACSFALLTAVSFNTYADGVDFSKLSQKDKDEIGKIASDYLVQNPEILMKAYNSLQAKQQKEQENKSEQSTEIVIKNSQAILEDPNTPFIGPKDAKFAIIEFFDYNCVFCSKTAPALKEIIEKNKDVKFIFKEMPIFEDSFVTSKLGARLGIKVFKEKGSEAYVKYHNAIYETNHYEGTLTVDDVKKAAESVGVTADLKDGEYEDVISKNMALATEVGLNGTPAFVFMATSNHTDENTLVNMGALTVEQLQNVIDQLRTQTSVKNKTVQKP